MPCPECCKPFPLASLRRHLTSRESDGGHDISEGGDDIGWSASHDTQHPFCKANGEYLDDSITLFNFDGETFLLVQEIVLMDDDDWKDLYCVQMLGFEEEAKR